MSTFEGEKYPASLSAALSSPLSSVAAAPLYSREYREHNESIIHKAADRTEQKLLVNSYLYVSAQINISLFLIDLP